MHPGSLIRSPATAWAAGLAGLGLLVWLALASTAQEVASPVTLANVPYQGSASCRACHPSHYESWHRTFHRTMTQEATPTSILGDFGGASYTFDGVTSRFTREQDRFFIETLDATGKPHRYPIERTVGSRRIQQYVTREGVRYLRLPLAWNIDERRWFHLNGGFLDPDGTDFNSHRTIWDANCIFCHNVKAQPGYDWSQARFNSRVAELGIACEACHAPGQEHVSRNHNPLRRYFLYYSGRDDLSIVDPQRLTPLHQVQICGHCHGQRLPKPLDRIRQFLAEGDPYTAGEDLSAYTEPIHADSTLAGVDLTARFWKDGTPRLSAYEYQGLLMSPDFQRGGLTCQHCHTMHGGDPKGMIQPVMRGPAACQGCHAEIAAHPAEHSGHRKDGSGSDCYACHMPKITYGLLDVHPTHRIQKPDPSRAWRHDMPEACTLCHTDKTARWAAEALARQQRRPPPADLPTDPAFQVAESLRALEGGDVVQRAVAAMALGDARSATADPIARLWAVPFLLRTLEDPYASVRHFAYRSLKRLLERAATVQPAFANVSERLPAFDPQAPADERQRVVTAWRAWWSQLPKTGLHPDAAVPLDAALEPIPEILEPIRKHRSEKTVSIGE